MAFYLNWPVFVCVHYHLTAIALRNEPGGRDLALNHPIASCTLCVFIASSGTAMSNVFMGQPVLDNISESPNDIVYTVSNKIYLKLCLNVLEEIRRSRNIIAGVTAAAKVYPSQSLLPLALTGMLKGTGKRWSIQLHQVFTGGVVNRQHELLQPSFYTKASFLLAMFYTVMFNNGLLDHDVLVLIGSSLLCCAVQEKLWNCLTMKFEPNNTTTKEEKKIQ